MEAFILVSLSGYISIFVGKFFEPKSCMNVWIVAWPRQGEDINNSFYLLEKSLFEKTQAGGQFH